MSVQKFSPTPGGKSGKPSPPNSFSVTPSGAGSKPCGSALNLPSGSVGGNAAQKHDPKKNYASKATKTSGVRSIGGSMRSKLPSAVQTGFKVKP